MSGKEENNPAENFSAGFFSFKNKCSLFGILKIITVRTVHLRVFK